MAPHYLLSTGGGKLEVQSLKGGKPFIIDKASPLLRYGRGLPGSIVFTIVAG